VGGWMRDMGGPFSDAPKQPDVAPGTWSLGARLTNLLAAFDTIHLTVLGIALYVTVYFSYSTFYGRFGVAPAEVGLTYLEILTRSAPPLLVLMGTCVLIVLLSGRWLLGKQFTAQIRYPLATVVVVVLLVLVAGWCGQIGWPIWWRAAVRFGPDPSARSSTSVWST
jgi:hypothetical protein